MDRSTVLPRTPSVESTTALFSLTSRSFRPLHRTTTLMFVSSLNWRSNSRSFLFAPTWVDVEAIDKAGETAPERVGGGAEGALADEGRGGGRMFILRTGAVAGARGPAIRRVVLEMLSLLWLLMVLGWVVLTFGFSTLARSVAVGIDSVALASCSAGCSDSKTRGPQYSTLATNKETENLYLKMIILWEQGR